ncbi:hypothetical protein LOY64_12110 [Pseudomonas corrugata]|nr:hypothetical protein [Pseudomonas corrugata]UZD97704.1 hypothetical protein LOY64_12110 [Pseudomonas corrugata]
MGHRAQLLARHPFADVPDELLRLAEANRSVAKMVKDQQLPLATSQINNGFHAGAECSSDITTTFNDTYQKVRTGYIHDTALSSFCGLGMHRRRTWRAMVRHQHIPRILDDGYQVGGACPQEHAAGARLFD